MRAVRLFRRLRRRVAWRPKCAECYHLRLARVSHEYDGEYAEAAIVEGRLRAHQRDDHPAPVRDAS